MMAKQKKSPTKKLLFFGGIIVVVFCIGAVLASSMGWLGEGDAGKLVETAKAKYKNITQVVSASGKIQPEVEVIVRPDVSGEITQLNVKEGDYVKKGELLVRIKPDIYQAKIAETNATLLTQKARMQQAKASLVQAESAYEQQKKLHEKNLASEASYVKAKSDYEAQKANYKASEYQVQSVEAQLQQAKEELDQTIIRAPKDGTVSSLAIEQGERVLGNEQMAGTEMMHIADMDHMEVQVQVNENDIVNVAVGDTANIQADAYPERTFKGIVTEIANSADVSGEGTTEQVTNYEVKIRIITPHNLDMAGAKMQQKRTNEIPTNTFSPDFKPGMSATVDVQTETVQQAVAIPIQAVTVRNFAKDETAKNDSANTDSTESMVIPKEDLRKVVFVVNDGKAERREVKTGISDATDIQILSGLKNGDEVVIGNYRTLSKELADGDAVKVNNNRYKNLTASK